MRTPIVLGGAISDDGSRLVLAGVTPGAWDQLRADGFIELSQETLGVVWPAGVTVLVFVGEGEADVVATVADFLGPHRLDQRRPM